MSYFQEKYFVVKQKFDIIYKIWYNKKKTYNCQKKARKNRMRKEEYFREINVLSARFCNSVLTSNCSIDKYLTIAEQVRERRTLAENMMKQNSGNEEKMLFDIKMRLLEILSDF